MLIGIPKEVKRNESRVGATPDMVRDLVARGHTVYVERDAGADIGYPDSLYQAAGGLIREAIDVYQAELVIKVKEPQREEFRFMRDGQALFCYLHLAAEPELTAVLLEKNMTAIAYETVTDDEGKLPLLTPMSAIAGRLSIIAGSDALKVNRGGKGVLLSSVGGVHPGKVLIIGGGVSGTEALYSAVGIGADVTVLDTNKERLRALEEVFGNKIKTAVSSRDTIQKLLPEMDLVIGAVLAKGKRAPQLITRDMLRTMEKGSALVDISIDQGGVFETSRPTTHDDPTYIEEGIVHYCVSNMPGSVARTATEALTSVTLPYVRNLAEKGIKRALMEDRHLLNGLNTCAGEVTCEPVAHDLDYPLASFDKVLANL